MSDYTATATRSNQWWVVQCDQVPGAISQVKSLEEATPAITEAIVFVTGVPADAVRVMVSPVLPPAVQEALESAAMLRERAEQSRREAAAEYRRASRELATAGVSRRDIGGILGVSRQRVHQLLGG
ncbi:MAG: hypothetical protein LBG11_03550 [Bifidobacteriaceae bacterium]|nr:hypothetical protein [Bifidobacteriaceae bacterium]